MIIGPLQKVGIETCRDYLGRWRGDTAVNLTPTEVARVSIELGLIGSHRHVFGPVAWFIVLGPAGAIVYRMSAILSEKWGARSDAEFGAFGIFAQRFFFWFDWVPVRLTAASFAIVRTFQDA